MVRWCARILFGHSWGHSLCIHLGVDTDRIVLISVYLAGILGEQLVVRDQALQRVVLHRAGGAGAWTHQTAVGASVQENWNRNRKGHETRVEWWVFSGYRCY